MQWIVQNNLFEETAQQKFIDNLNELNISYNLVKIPFSHEILPDVNPSIAVLDNNEFKIIEINCLNSSGFYSR